MRRKNPGSALGAGLLLFVVLDLLASSARADLEFREVRADAGNVRTGPALRHSFAFVNRGPTPIEIVDARASCGCLTPHLAQYTYQAGEQGTLVLEVNTLSQAPGPHTWRVDLRYRCGDRFQDAALLLSGTLITEVKVEPAAMELFVDRPVSQDVLVTDLRTPGFRIVGAASTAAALKAQAGVRYQDTTGHWACRVTVEVADEYPEGRHDETLSIYTDDPLYHELRVPVTVVKHPRQRVSATPAAVSLSAAPGQPVPSRIVLLRDRESRPVVVAGVQAEDPAVHCQWAAGPGTMATLKISVDRTQMRGDRVNTVVHVRLGQPVTEVLNLPVSCSVR